MPPKYYDTSLEERARELGCAPEQLCKTMIMENKAFVEVRRCKAKKNQQPTDPVYPVQDELLKTGPQGSSAPAGRNFPLNAA